MKHAFIIHGAYGNPEENWIPWVKGQLEQKGYNVVVPEFPTPVGQNLENWLKVFDQFKDQVNSETILIGHSIACAFILRVLEQINVQIDATFLVAPFIRGLNNDEVDEINATFYDKPFDWEKIKSNCKNFVCFIADNDPYVPLSQAEVVAEGLGVQLTVVKDAGHFNAKAGYTTFPELLEKL